MVYILCHSRTWSQRKCLFNVNLFSFPRDKNEGYWKESGLVEEVITFFFKSQRNNAFIFSEMTQFALWYAPLNVSGQTSLPCIVFFFFFTSKDAHVSPLINLSPDFPKCKSACTRVVPPYNDDLKMKHSLAGCSLLHFLKVREPSSFSSKPSSQTVHLSFLLPLQAGKG